MREQTIKIVCLEKMVIELNQYFHRILRARPQYVSNHDEAKLPLSDLIQKKYQNFLNKDYLS